MVVATSSALHYPYQPDIMVYTADKITQYIHIVGESIVWRIIDTPVNTNARILAGHETEVVTCLQVIPILLDTTVITQSAHALPHYIIY